MPADLCRQRYVHVRFLTVCIRCKRVYTRTATYVHVGCRQRERVRLSARQNSRNDGPPILALGVGEIGASCVRPQGAAASRKSDQSSGRLAISTANQGDGLGEADPLRSSPVSDAVEARRCRAERNVGELARNPAMITRLE